MFSSKDKLEFKRFFGRFVILVEFLLIFYIVSCAWFLGQAAKEENESHFKNVRKTVTFFFLPLMLIYLFYAVFTDPGDMRILKNKLYSYLNHLEYILSMINEEWNYNKEIELLVKPHENDNLQTLNELMNLLKEKNIDCLEKESSVLFDIIEKISSSYKIEIEECSICHEKKLTKVHHCSTCEICVADMDHHCPWIANCIGINTAKPFMLFCFSMSILTGYWGYTIFQYFIIPRLFDFDWNRYFLFFFMLSSSWISLGLAVFGLFMMIYYLKNIFTNTTCMFYLKPGIDEKKNKKFKKRSMAISLFNVFGSYFLPFWFLPFSTNLTHKISFLVEMNTSLLRKIINKYN